jgi:hypothetical protein
MRMKLFLVSAVAAAAALAALAGGVAAAGPGALYSFAGTLAAAPSGGHLTITVEGGNPAALRLLIGASSSQTFAYGSDTRFTKATGGVPTVVEPGDLAAGDHVRVNVRAPRGSSLGTVEGTAAAAVVDRGTDVTKPDQPLYLFRGTVTSVGGSSLSVDVRGGNRRALRLMVGHSAGQTFTVGGSTIVLRWQGGKPSTISLGDLKAGDPVAIRVRAAAGSTLDQVEATAAVKVAAHEPKKKAS